MPSAKCPPITDHRLPSSRVHRLFSTSLLLVAAASLASEPQTAANPVLDDPALVVSAARPSPVRIQTAASANAVRLSASVGGLRAVSLDEGTVWRIDNEGVAGIEGRPDLPAVSRWVRVPDRGRLELHYTVKGERRQAGSPPARFIGGEEDEPEHPPFLPPASRGEEGEQPILSGVWPPEPAVMSSPAVWRGVRMVNVVIYPARWDAGAGDYILADEIETEIVNLGDVGENEVPDIRREPCRDYDLALRALLVNPPPRDESDEDYPPGGYLVVANVNPPDAVGEFVEWKRRTGHQVELLTFDPAQVGRVELKAMIRDRYQESGFSYLVLMGNEEADPPLRIPYPPNDGEFYDNYFGQLEGDDPVADVAVGTYNCQTVANLTCAVRRTISYESAPFVEDDAWFSHAFVGVGHCNPPDQLDLSPSYSGKWVQEVLERHGFDVSSTYFSDNQDNDFSPEVADEYNLGVNLIIVRGHQTDFDPDAIEAGPVYPFHFLVSSSTISPGVGQWTGSFNMAFRVGTPEDMRGPSAGFGHCPSPRTNIANALVGGLIEALFVYDIKSFGWARNYLTAKIPIVMPADQGQTVTRYWGTLRYYGDPGQEPWIGRPRELRVIHPQGIAPTATAMQVECLFEEEGVSDVTVTLYQEGGLQQATTPDVEGYAWFTWSPDQLTQEPIQVTVTGSGTLPYHGQIEVGDGPEILTIEDFTFHDSPNGNGDGIPNPGELGLVSFALMNRSGADFPFQNLECRLFGLTPWVFAAGGYEAEEGVLAPGERLEVEGALVVRIWPGCPDGLVAPLGAFSVADGVNRIAGTSLTINASDLQLVDLRPEGDIAPGDVFDLSPIIRNAGSVAGNQIRARLEVISAFVQAEVGAVNYPAIESGEEAEPEGESFRLRVAENAIPGSIVWLRLIVEGEPGVADTLSGSFNLAGSVAADPVGPDAYGYIALDDGDDAVEWAEPPEYSWVDCNPWSGEVQGQLLPFPVNGETDSSVVVELPFVLRYYGQEFRQITVCNNGWIAVGDQHRLKNQQNWPTPGFNGAYGMIAPFWDRLEMLTRSDGVFSYHDAQAGRFIIQWETGTRANADWAANAFEVILFDPERHRTATGDSPILFQYDIVNNVQDRWEGNTFCTVGISSPDDKDGLTYTYWNNNSPGARGLAAERAILWTTIAYAPRAVLQGRVVRWMDSTAVEGATVRTSTGLSTFSDRDGSYRISSGAAEGVTVTASAERYGEASVEGIQLAEGDTTNVQDLVLPHGWIETDEDSLIMTPFPDAGYGEGSILLMNLGNMPATAIPSIVVPDSAFWDERLVIEFGEDTLVLETDSEAELLIRAEGIDGQFFGLLRLTTDTPVPVIELPIEVWVGATSVSRGGFQPEAFQLEAPYPNPFNAWVTIKYAVPKPSNVSLVLFDLTGRKLRLLTGGRREAGRYVATLDASNLAAGVYLVRLDADGFSKTAKLVLVK